ncbi:MAG TPA: hypothetical protein VMP01_11165 [Pirellulaceae bacterium]|nr:hypothetical protein [Pirellulaceae bacterium]
MSKHPLMTDVLRKTINKSGEYFLTLEQATGIKRQSLMKFARGEQSLRLDMADKLAEFFGLVLTEDSRRPAKGSKQLQQAARTRKLRSLAELAKQGLEAVKVKDFGTVKKILNKIQRLGDV